MKQYVIKKNCHYPNRLIIPEIWSGCFLEKYKATIEFSFIGEPMSFFNKLYGIRSIFGARFHSYRIAWRINSDYEFEVCAMSENKKTFRFQAHHTVPIQWDKIKQKHFVQFEFTITPYEFLLNKEHILINSEWLSFYSYPYFGGPETADQDYTITIERINKKRFEFYID